MAGFSSSHVTVTEFEFKKVGKNQTPLLELEIMEPQKRKNKETGKYEVIDHNTYTANIWGDATTQAQLDIEKGTVLDLSPEIVRDGDNKYVRHRAYVNQQTWEHEGKEYYKYVVTINDYKVKD